MNNINDLEKQIVYLKLENDKLRKRIIEFKMKLKDIEFMFLMD